MKSILLLLLGLLGIILYSQQKEATISFVDEIYDFGEIKEADGKVTHSFEFTNTGSLPLVLYNVKPTCGCTTPKWSREPIQPGAKGFIDAIFDPKRRPGNFNKGITIKSNASNGLIVLRIKGNVIPKELTVEDKYPHIIGGLRLKSSNFAFGKINVGQKKTEIFNIVNSSQVDVEISFRNVPKCLSIEYNPKILKPGQEGEIIAVYDATVRNDWDFVMDKMFLMQNGENLPKNNITVSAIIAEDFSNLTEEELLKAPVIEFDHKSYDFGTVKQQSKVTHAYTFTNTGKSDLIIRKVKASCGCTAVEPVENVIKPGKSSEIKAIFNVGSRKNKQSKSITVISNDPKKYKVVLKLSGVIEVN